jgi:hypothetical protein
MDGRSGGKDAWKKWLDARVLGRMARATKWAEKQKATAADLHLPSALAPR